jgi:hypothetical protein
MKFFLSAVLFSTHSMTLSAQDGVRDFDEVTRADLQMKAYLRDTSADAVYLFDQGTLEVDLYTGTKYTRHLRVKIFRKSALEQGDFRILAPTGALSKIRGATYNLENGEIIETKISSDDVFKTKVVKGLSLTAIPFRNVKEGSVIDCRYTYSEPYLVTTNWQFQYPFPVIWSEYFVISQRTFSYHVRGPFPLTHSNANADRTRNYFRMENIPAFHAEPDMPDHEAYQASLVISREQSWEDVRKSLYSSADVARSFNDRDIRPYVDSLLRGTVDSLEKVRRISAFIKKRIEWNKKSDFDYDDPGEVWKRKKGNSGDINALLACMLRMAGFHPHSVMLGTRAYGFIFEDTPSKGQFNYQVCLIRVGGHDLLLDATEKLLPYDMLPPRCFNHKGFLLNGKKFAWIPVEPVRSYKTSVEANLTLGEDGNLEGKGSLIFDGYAAFTSRMTLKKLGDEEYRKDKIDSTTFSISGIENLDDIAKPLVVHYDLNLAGYATAANGLIYFDPGIFPDRDFFEFREPTRNYPVDFGYILDKTVVCTIAIPPGYELDELPQGKVLSIDNKSATYALNVARFADKVNITWRLKINRTLFQPSEYVALRDFYARVVSKKSENIVFRKKP